MIETFILYNTILLLSVLFAYYAEHSKTERSRIFARFCIFMVLFVPSSLRYEIGTDYIAYVDFFYFSTGYKETEIGFFALTVLLRNLHLPAHSLFVCSAILTYFPLMFLERKNYTWKIMMYVLSFYLLSYNTMRNMISLSYIILSFDLFFRNRKLLSIIIYTFSLLFHASSFVFIPFFGVNKLRCNRVLLLIISIILLGISNLNVVFSLLNNEWFLNTNYGGYMYSNHYLGVPNFNTGYSIVLMILHTVFLFIYFLFSKNKNYTLIYLALFYLASIVLSKNILIFSRVAEMFKVSLIFVVPFCLNLWNKRRTILLRYLTILFYIAIFEVVIKSNNGNSISGDHGISPYQTILNK